MIYYLVISCILFYGFYAKNPKNYRKYCFIMLWFFVAFRNIDLGGTDASVYQTLFGEVPTLLHFSSYKGDYEIGFCLIMSVCKTIINDYRFFQVIYSTISILLLYVLFEILDLNEKDKNLVLFVYFCFRFFLNNFVLLRQNIATLLVWIVIVSFYNRSFLKGMIIAFSGTFHITSLVNFIMYPVYYVMRYIGKVKSIIVTAAISLFLVTAGSNILNQIINIFVQITSSKYSRYLIEGSSAIRGFNFTYYLIRWFFVLLFLLIIEFIEYEHREQWFFFACMAIIIGSVDAEIFTRMMEYFMFSIYIIMAVSYQGFKRYQRTYIPLLFVACNIILMRSLLTTDGGAFMNYCFWFR